MRNRILHAILVDEKVVPATLLQWGEWLEKSGRHIGLNVIHGVRISTVFLGIDHGWGDRSLWFETMIFGGKHDEFQQRYETIEEAKEGHKQALEMVRKSE